MVGCGVTVTTPGMTEASQALRRERKKKKGRRKKGKRMWGMGHL